MSDGGIDRGVLKYCREEMFWMEEGSLLNAVVKRGMKLLAQ